MSRPAAYTTCIIVAFAAGLCFMQSCKCGFYKCDDDITVSQPTITGNWHYVRFQGGIGGLDSNTAALQYSLHLQEDKSYSITQDTASGEQGYYYLYLMPNQQFAMHMSARNMDYLLFLSQDTLRLQENNSDPYIYTYLLK